MNQKINELIPHNIHFWYASADYRKIFYNVLNNKKEYIDHLIFLKNTGNQNQTLTLMNFVQKSFSLDWKSEKKRIAEMMLKKAEEIFPGFYSLIEVIEIGSPTTFERYTSNIDGALYGFENTKSMYGEAKMPIITHIDNLFQTGHWGKPGCSVWNVMSNAYTASKIILKQ
jgi:phytoene dehydrogenase-like protein